jgi:hypothetical protein
MSSNCSARSRMKELAHQSNFSNLVWQNFGGAYTEWFKPVRVLFGMISLVEVALTYLAITFFAISMSRVGWLGKTSSKVYILISLLGFILIVLSAFLPEPYVTAGFAVSIPAIPFLMPYFMGIVLLSRTGD